MRLLRRALLLLGLLVGSGVFARCAPDNMLILVTVNGLPASGTQMLQVDLLLSGNNTGQRLEVAMNPGQFAISLPNRDDQRGMLSITAAALASDGCALGVGTVTVNTAADGPSYAVDLNLITSVGKQCGLAITVTGPGTVTATDGVNPFRCNGQCQTFFPLGAQVTLTAVANPHSYSTLWSGDCSGPASSSCTLMMQAPKSVGVTFASLQCSPDNWCNFSSGVQSPLNSVSGSGPNDVWAVGDTGVATHWDGTKWTPSAVLPTQNLYAVTGDAQHNFWAVGDGPQLFQLSVTGWASAQNFVPSDFRAFGLDPSLTGWIVGTAGKIYQVVRGATTMQNSQTTNDLLGVWGSDTSNLWAVGNAGTILFGDGLGWSPQGSGTTNNLLDISGLDPRNLWAVGILGTILKGNGSTWSAQDSGTMKPLHHVWVSDAKNVWAVGGAGTILKWNGMVWAPQNSGTASTLLGIWGSGPSDIWAVGVGGTIVHYQP